MQKSRFTFLALLLIFTLLWPVSSVGAQLAPTTAVVMLNAVRPADVAALNLQPTLQLDYGSFLWLEIPVSKLALLKAAAIDYQQINDPYTLTLGEQRFDPQQTAPRIPAGWQSSTSQAPNLHLVQFVGPTRPEWLDGLQNSGLQVVQYIHPYTYVVWGPSTALNRAAQASVVRWVGAFEPAYRVLPRWRSLPADVLAVHVMFYRGADVDGALKQIEALGGKLDGRSPIDATFEVAGFSLAGDRLQAVAQIAGVYSVQPVMLDGGARGEMSSQI